MSVKYLNVNIQIHGVDIVDKECIEYLKARLKSETKFVLTCEGYNDMFRFSGDESDLTVEVVEYTGKTNGQDNHVRSIK